MVAKHDKFNIGVFCQHLDVLLDGSKLQHHNRKVTRTRTLGTSTRPGADRGIYTVKLQVMLVKTWQ